MHALKANSATQHDTTRHGMAHDVKNNGNSHTNGILSCPASCVLPCATAQTLVTSRDNAHDWPNTNSNLGEKHCSSKKFVAISGDCIVDGFRADFNVHQCIIGTNAKLVATTFACCEQLHTVVLGNNVVIGKGVFQACEALENVTIGSNAEIGKYAFQSCPNLIAATIGPGAVIEKCAFANCAALRHLVVGANCTNHSDLTIVNGGFGFGDDSNSEAALAMKDEMIEDLRKRISVLNSQIKAHVALKANFDRLQDTLVTKENEVENLTRALEKSECLLKRAEREQPQLLDRYKCPITTHVMEDPVICPSGHAFERSAIEQWLNAFSKTNPLTRAELDPASLKPHIMLKREIESLRAAFSLRHNDSDSSVDVNFRPAEGGASDAQGSCASSDTWDPFHLLFPAPNHSNRNSNSNQFR